MKVWEKCNELKNTHSSKETIARWAYMNRVCPIEFSDELEVDSYPKEMTMIAKKCCITEECGNECLNKFLESEM